MQDETIRIRPPFDPDPEEMRRLGYLAVDGLVQHLSTLGEQRVAQRGTAEEFARRVDEPLPERGDDLEESIRFVMDRVVPGMTRVNHPRFHAYIPCPSSFAGMLGEVLAAGTNPFAGSWLGGATFSSLELTTLRWIAELIGYPHSATGILTSGGSMANLAALAAARETLPRADRARATIYVSAEGHASMDKAATVLGWPTDAIRHVEVDDRFRMRPEALAAQLAADRAAGHVPFFVAANAGTTNAGAVDPLVDLADLCERERLWFHVDGAYGGFAAITAEGRALLSGMERADSLTLDPHKWLYAPMGCGCVLVRRAGALEAAFAAHGDYLQDLPPDEVNFLDRGPELSRPARMLAVWMVIRTAGRAGLDAQIREDLRLARLAARLLAEDDRLELVDPPQLSVVTFRHALRPGEDESARSRRDLGLMEDTLADGTLMLSTSQLGRRSALRLVVMNHRTSEVDVRRSVEKIRELVK